MGGHSDLIFIMIYDKETIPSRGLGETFADEFKEAITPNWLALVIKTTGIFLIAIIILAMIQ